MTHPRRALRRVFRIVNGGTPTSEPENWDGGIPWATPIDIGAVNGQRLESTARTITARGLRIGSRAVPARSLIVSTRAPIGYVAEVDRRTAFNQGCRGLVPIRELDPRYFRYQLLSMATRLDSLGQGSTFRELTTDALASTSASVPLVSLQRRIADLLDAETARIDAVNAKRRDQLHLLSERQTVIINSLVSGAIQTGAHGVPIGHAGSPSARLGNLAHVQGGLTLDGGRDLGSDTIELPYLRVANVQDGRVDLTEVKTVRVPKALAARCSLAPGDVLMTEGGDPDKLGRGTVWAGLIPHCLHQNHVFAVRPDQTRLDPAYLALMTRTQYARVYFEMTAAKTTGIASTSATKITAFRVPLIDLGAQRSQVADVDRRLADVDSIILPVTRQIALMKERRQALITAAVTGAIDVSTASGRGVPA